MDKKKKVDPWKLIIGGVIVVVVGSLAFCASPSQARDVYVDGHVRKDGTYVAPHHRSAPDNNQYNNYGSAGNTNPYTGQQGNVQPQPNYGQPLYPAQPSNRGNSSQCLYGQRC